MAWYQGELASYQQALQDWQEWEEQQVGEVQRRLEEVERKVEARAEQKQQWEEVSARLGASEESMVAGRPGLRSGWPGLGWWGLF